MCAGMAMRAAWQLRPRLDVCRDGDALGAACGD